MAVHDERITIHIGVIIMTFTQCLIIHEFFVGATEIATHKEYRYFPNLLIHKDPSKRDRHFTNWMWNLRAESQVRFGCHSTLRLVKPLGTVETKPNDFRFPKGGLTKRS